MMTLPVALRELQWASFGAPKVMLKAHYQSLSAFLRGDLTGAYKGMAVILQYYFDKHESLPSPCATLYRNILINDALEAEIG